LNAGEDWRRLGYDPRFCAKDPSRASGAYATFQPGARSAWHTHPIGQILLDWLEKVSDTEYGWPSGVTAISLAKEVFRISGRPE
jgi:hypothetical protein